MKILEANESFLGKVTLDCLRVPHRIIGADRIAAL